MPPDDADVRRKIRYLQRRAADAQRAIGERRPSAITRRVRRALSERFVLTDVPGDGDCVCWSVKPALERRLGRTLSIGETRNFIVNILKRDRFAPFVRQDFVQTNAMRRERGAEPLANECDLFAHWSQQYVHLPPIGVARAVAWFTGLSVRLWMIEGATPWVAYRSNDDASNDDATVGDFDVELAFDQNHMSCLTPLTLYGDMERSHRRLEARAEREVAKRRRLFE